MRKICSVPDCGQRHFGHGWCNKHYQQMRKKGVFASSPKSCHRPSPVEGERWRVIPEFKEYWCSDLGRFFSSKTERELIPAISPKGYGHISFMNCGKQRVRLAHRIILETFSGTRPEGKVVCHANGIRNDNRLSNLRWDTQAGNCADKIIHGTYTCGEQQRNAKLTEAAVREIRVSTLSASQLAKKFSVDPTLIYRVRLRKSWSLVV